MTTWDPGDGEREVMSLGSDTGPRPPRSRVVAVAAVCLVVGFLAGGRADLAGLAGPAAAEVGPSVSVGAVATVPEAPDGSEFDLPVFNPGPGPVRVSLIDLGGVGPRSSTTSRVRPGAWGAVRFTSPGCHELVPDGIERVRLHLRGPAGQRDADLALPGQGQQLVEYHLDVCAPAYPVQRSKLYGVWVLEKVFGRATRQEGLALVRFAPDGTFVADAGGRLLSDHVAVRGRYRVHRLLLLHLHGGTTCRAPGTSRWQAKIRVDGRLSLAWVGGRCPVQPGGLWVFRKVLRYDGLPAVAPAPPTAVPAR